MRAQRKERAAPDAGRGGSLKDGGGQATTESEIKHLARGIQVSAINKGRGSQLRVLVSAWRGLNRIEIREYTEVCPGTSFPTKSGVIMPVDLVDDLIGALAAAKDRASSLGLLSRRTKP